MRGIVAFLCMCLLAALVPLWSPNTANTAIENMPEWPSSFEGHVLRQLPCSAREQRFQQEFPGRIGRFTDGRRELIIRWVTKETRTLHSAADCFRGLGYTVTPRPLYRDTQGRYWGVFAAQKGKERLRIRELITDRQGKTWSDVSHWYWAAAFQRTRGPWWVYTLAEREGALH